MATKNSGLMLLIPFIIMSVILSTEIFFLNIFNLLLDESTDVALLDMEAQEKKY